MELLHLPTLLPVFIKISFFIFHLNIYCNLENLVFITGQKEKHEEVEYEEELSEESEIKQ